MLIHIFIILIDEEKMEILLRKGHSRSEEFLVLHHPLMFGNDPSSF